MKEGIKLHLPNAHCIFNQIEKRNIGKLWEKLWVELNLEIVKVELKTK